MKLKYLLICIFTIISFAVNRQIINLDDSNFKEFLLSSADSNNIAQKELHESIVIYSGRTL